MTHSQTCKRVGLVWSHSFKSPSFSSPSIRSWIHSSSFPSKSKQLVSSPHPISNIRLVKYTQQPPIESIKAWKEYEEQVQVWHHTFWKQNNHDFMTCQAAFEDKILKETGKPATPFDLSLFYKDYLDTAYDRHVAYNKAWMKKNLWMVLGGLECHFYEYKFMLQHSWHSIYQVISPKKWLGSTRSFRAQGVTVR